MLPFYCKDEVFAPYGVELRVIGGNLLDVEPRFRGHDIVAPQTVEEESYAFSQWKRRSENDVAFSTRTWGNTITTSAGTQGIAIKVFGDTSTMIKGKINGQSFNLHLKDLIAGPKSSYLGGFLTPAYCFHRAIPENEFSARIDFVHHVDSTTRDWYYVRVRQSNGQWAWSSPIWVEKCS